jgi:predicted CoA-substrate-specific enzyme activase
MCKAVLSDGKAVLDRMAIKTGWNPKQSAEECLGVFLRRNGLNMQETVVSATGYGREAIDFADVAYTEITCHAFGALCLCQDIGGVIDIGGQDSKIIQIENGKVANFLMNDKCAAGTGRFLSMACDVLEVKLEDIDAFADTNEFVPINSMCTVFAESEIIGALAMQKDRSRILAGALHSIALKIKQMAGKVAFNKDRPIMMTGGLSRSQALINVISKTVGLTVTTHELALFAGALGACVHAAKFSNG